MAPFRRVPLRLAPEEHARTLADAQAQGIPHAELLRRRIRQEPASPAVWRAVRTWHVRAQLRIAEGNLTAWEEALKAKEAALAGARAEGAPVFLTKIAEADVALAQRQVALLRAEVAAARREIANLSTHESRSP